MSPEQVINTDPDKFSRCEERKPAPAYNKTLSSSEKTDADIKENIFQAFWKDNFLRAMEYDEIDVHVKNGIVHLSGHIVNTSSQSRIEEVIRDITGILEVRNNLVLDDKLTLEVAASLGKLEHTYGCKFFTGASHGVVSINGVVSAENIKLLAERCAAGNPNVRGVINNVRVSGVELRSPDQPFLQPAIGEIIYFIGGLSGVVKQVIIDPNNRRVIAMSVQGNFTDRQQELKSLNHDAAGSTERLVVIRMSAVRYLTKVSGFLNIHSNERKRYKEFDSGHFNTPGEDWSAPYPYCPGDVLFAVEQQDLENQTLQDFSRVPFVVGFEEQLVGEELVVNDSLGG